MEKNYYQLIGLMPDADSIQISEAIRSTRKRYRSLVGSPNPRQRLNAELALLDLEEVEKHLLDDELRRVYDQSIAAAVKQNIPEPKRKIVRHNYKLVRQANHALEAGNFRQAFDLAVAYIHKYGDTYEAWDIFYKASLELREYDQAIKALDQLIVYKPFDLSLKSLKFEILYELGLCGDALEFCNQLSNESKMYDLSFNIWVETCVAHLFCRLGRYQEASLKYRDLLERYPNEKIVQLKYNEDNQFYSLSEGSARQGRKMVDSQRDLNDLNGFFQYRQKDSTVGINFSERYAFDNRYIKFKNYLWWLGVFILASLIFGKYFIALFATVLLLVSAIIYICLP